MMPDALQTALSSFAIATLVTLALIPWVRRLAQRFGCVTTPQEDRWSSLSTPYLGGVAIVAGASVSVALFCPVSPLMGVILAMFVLGLIDDLRPMGALTKLLLQTGLAVVAVALGCCLQGLTPWPEVDALVTVAWIVIVTNAFNLMDNMDGLAGGVGFIALLFLAVVFASVGWFEGAALCCGLSGALVGFLCVNVSPASLFMGDSGSLFIGMALAVLTVEAQTITANPMVPLLLLIMLVADTGLVTAVRWARGRSIFQGGRDHISHRLVRSGFSEPAAVSFIHKLTLLGGGAALFAAALPLYQGAAISVGVCVVLAVFLMWLLRQDAS